MDSKTEFIVNDDSTIRRSKIQNMPNIRGNVEAYAYIGSDGYVKYVWITPVSKFSGKVSNEKFKKSVDYT